MSCVKFVALGLMYTLQNYRVAQEKKRKGIIPLRQKTKKRITKKKNVLAAANLSEKC